MVTAAEDLLATSAEVKVTQVAGNYQIAAEQKKVLWAIQSFFNFLFIGLMFIQA